MRKVVFLTTIPSPYRVSFFNEWGKKCDLTVIFEKESSSERNELWKQMDIQNFKPIFLKGISVKANKAFCPEIISQIKKLKFDVFVIGGYNTPTAMLASNWLKYHKVPYILNADGGYVKKDKKIVGYIKRKYISSASMWICSSDKTVEYFTHYGADSCRVFKYPFTSIREEIVLKEPFSLEGKKHIRDRLGIVEDKVVLTVGQFIYRKGFDLLLEVANQIKGGVGIYLIGGKITPEYQKIVKKNNLKNVHFLDFMDSKTLSDYYKAADIFVFPTREDIWGLVINEAVAYGLPIITTLDCIAGLEMVDASNGKLIRSDDLEELKIAINELIENEELIFELSKNSLKIARRFTIEQMVEQHMKIIEEFIRMYGGNSKK